MTAQVSLDIASFQKRLSLLRDLWNQASLKSASSDFSMSEDAANQFNNCDAMMFGFGINSDLTLYQKTTAVFSWLLGYEFSETVMLVTKAKVAFLTSVRKGAILDSLAAADSSIHVIKREKESGRSKQQFEEMLGVIKSSSANGVVRLGTVVKDKNEGPMLDEWMSFLSSANPGLYASSDITAAVSAVLASKDSTEIANIEAASKLTSLLMNDTVSKKILNCIDTDRRMTHVGLADEIEDFVANQLGKFKGKVDPAVKLEYVDICYPPIIQSGGNYSLKASAMSNEERLAKKGVILFSAGLRYKAYCSNMARSLLIDPLPEQEQQLTFLQSLQQHLASKMSAGAHLSSIFEAGLAFVRHNQPNLEKHVFPNFGFGIGLEFREPEHLINAKSNAVVKAGMTFNLMVGFQDLVIDGNKYSLMLADTVVVPKEGPVRFLTSGLASLSDLSFSIKKAPIDPTLSGPIKTRLRSQSSSSFAGKEESDRKRREHQKELGKQRIREALERYGSNEPDAAGGKKQEVQRYESYRKDTQLPKDIGAGGAVRIFVDKRSETVIIPVFGLAVPFHVNCIKNVTKNDEGEVSFIRFNFNSPGRTFGKKDANATSGFAEPHAHFIRGVTVRCADNLRAHEVFKEIQDLKKQVLEREAARKERADLVDQAQLIEVTGKRPSRLPDIYIRPGMEGKRLPGDLEIHQNGLRYRSQIRGDQRVDVLFSNIKHFIFQPCDHETLVILHLHLHHPIMIGKKKTKDIQFYREALESTVDETSGRRTKMRFGDEDEIAQEQEERRRRVEANNEFKTFAEKVADASRGALEVDVPSRDLGFNGVPGRQSVLMQPTTDCLVHLVEPPPFLVTLAEVEVAFLERVVFGLKNFDLVFVFKDHSIPPVHVNTIPMTQLEAVKEWLDSVEVYFVESKVNFNWTNIMKTVNEDPVGFYEMGGWTYLQPEEASEGSDAEDGSSEYEPDEDEEEVFESEDDEDYESDEEEEEDDEEEEEEDFTEEDEDDDDGYDESSDEEPRGKKRPPMSTKGSSAPKRKK